MTDIGTDGVSKILLFKNVINEEQEIISSKKIILYFQSKKLLTKFTNPLNVNIFSEYYWSVIHVPMFMVPLGGDLLVVGIHSVIQKIQNN